MQPVVGPPQYAPAPTSGDLNSHPEISVRTSTSVTRVIVLCPYAKFEVRKPSRYMADFRHGVNQPGDLHL